MSSAARNQAIAAAILADANPAPRYLDASAGESIPDRQIHNYTVTAPRTVELVPCPGGCDCLPERSVWFAGLKYYTCSFCYDGTEDAGEVAHLCGVADWNESWEDAAERWNEAVAEHIADRTLGPELPGEPSVWDWHEQHAQAAGGAS